MNIIKKILKQHWFLGLLLGAVALGLAVPAPGMLLSEKVGAKPFIFILLFISSLSFNTSQLLEGFKSAKAIFVSLAGTYLILPFLFYLCMIWVFGREHSLGIGLIVMGSGPTSLASAAIWTRLSGGNAALCVALILISNVLNILIGPFLLWLMLERSLAPDPFMVLQDLVVFVLLPIAVGQVVHRFVAEKQKAWAKPLGVTARLILLLVIIQAASKAASKVGGKLGASGETSGQALTVTNVIALVLCCIVCHLLTMAAMEILGRWARLEWKTRIAVIFIGSQKTLPVAIFLMGAYFSEYSLGVLSLVVYHALQLVVDSFFIEPFKRRVKENSDAEAIAAGAAET